MHKKPAHLIQMLEKSETDYNQFLHLYMQLLTISMQQLAFIPAPVTIRRKAERHIISSLHLIEKMHMHLFARKSLLADPLSKTEYEEPYPDQEEFEFTLLEFQTYMKAHQFTKTIYREQCKNVLNQIKKYHFHYSIKVIVEHKELPKPWKPKKLNVY